MNDATKKKLAIAGAAVFVLGAGVYLWPGDRSEPLDTPQADQRVRIVRTPVETQERERKIRELVPPEPPSVRIRPNRPRTTLDEDNRVPRGSRPVERKPKRDKPKTAA